MIARCLIAALIVSSLETASFAEELRLNKDRQPTPAVMKDYFFQAVVPVTPNLGFLDDGSPPAARAILDDTYVVTSERNALGGVINRHKQIEAPDRKTDEIYGLLKKRVAEQLSKGDKIVSVFVPKWPEPGFCGGIVIHAGVTRVTLNIFSEQVGGADVAGNWYTVLGNKREYWDSAICLGPVSSTPFGLEISSADLRSLRDALLVVSGLTPFKCEPSRDKESEICTFLRAKEVVVRSSSAK